MSWPFWRFSFYSFSDSHRKFRDVSVVDVPGISHLVGNVLKGFSLGTRVALCYWVAYCFLPCPVHEACESMFYFLEDIHHQLTSWAVLLFLYRQSFFVIFCFTHIVFLIKEIHHVF